MMTEEAEHSAGWLRDWSSHEAIRALDARVTYWRRAAALLGAALALLAGVVIWSHA